MHDRTEVEARDIVVPPQAMKDSSDIATTAAITRLVELSSRYAWLVILGFLLIAG
jgi:hypothetical protein